MASRERVLDLGSFRRFDEKKCITEKKEARIGTAELPIPLVVSLVIPAKISADEEARRIESASIRRVFSVCGKLVNSGYLDEIVVIDGTRGEDGAPDYDALRDIVKEAYDRIRLFHRQVNFMREHATARESVQRGIFDFVLKVVHQFDPKLDSILDMCGVKRAVGTIPPGKGAALWLTVPLTKGHVVCCVDSDIPNFSRKFVIALCHPILSSWIEERPIRMVKAYYSRLTFSPYEGPRTYRLGGRVTRLFMIPYLRTLSNAYPDLFGGLESLRYPLSGEIAMRRGVIEGLSFPNDYSLEISSLLQVKERFGLPSLAQVNLGFVHHIGQSDTELTEMIQEIVGRLIARIEEKGIRLTEEDERKLLSDYARRVPRVLVHYEKLFKRMRRRIEDLVRRRVVYSRDIEKATWEIFMRSLSTAPGGRRDARVLPPWMDLTHRTDYFTLRRWMNVWANWSTRSRLIEAGIIK